MGERGERKRFARAVEHKAARAEDEEFRAELEVIGRLQQAGADPSMDQRDRQDVAVRLARKAAEPEAPSGEPGRVPNSTSTRTKRRRRLRPVLATTLGVTTGLLGLAVLFSSNALPGDGLYTVKRARESAVLAVTFDDRAAASQRLDYAADRVTELEQLVAHRDGRDDLPAAYRSGLADFDRATRDSAATLTAVGTNSGGGAVNELRDWSAHQSRRLSELRPSPEPAAMRKQEGSARLLDRIVQRATALRDRFDCYRITAGDRDALGPIPASGKCVTTTGERDDERASADPESERGPATKGRKPAPTSESNGEPAARPRGPERVGSTGRPATGSRATPPAPAPTSRHDRERFHPGSSAPVPPRGRPHRPTGSADERPTAQPPDLVDTVHGLVTDVLSADSTDSGPDTASSPTPAAR